MPLNRRTDVQRNTYLDTRVKDKFADEEGSRTMSKVTTDDLNVPSKIEKKKGISLDRRWRA